MDDDFLSPPIDSTTSAQGEVTMEEDRARKQQYLVDEVANKGFDTAQFAQYMEYKKRKTSPRIIYLILLTFV